MFFSLKSDDPHSDSVILVWPGAVTRLYSWGDWGPGVLSDLPKVTLLIEAGVKFQRDSGILSLELKAFPVMLCCTMLAQLLIMLSDDPNHPVSWGLWNVDTEYVEVCCNAEGKRQKVSSPALPTVMNRRRTTVVLTLWFPSFLSVQFCEPKAAMHYPGVGLCSQAGSVILSNYSASDPHVPRSSDMPISTTWPPTTPVPLTMVAALQIHLTSLCVLEREGGVMVTPALWLGGGQWGGPLLPLQTPPCLFWWDFSRRRLYINESSPS